MKQDETVEETLQLTKEQADELALAVVDHSGPAMRVVIGDSTPRQYDRADQMAVGIKRAVHSALVGMGLRPEEE